MSKQAEFSLILEQFKRLQEVSGTRTHTGLAAFLGVRQSCITDALRRKKIPAEWILLLVQLKNVSPEWILTGRGKRFLEPIKKYYDDADTAMENEAEIAALQRLPAKALADELLRRIAITER